MNAPATTIERATRERGIPFSGPMVRAILDGTKTQTRRIVKPQPSFRYPGTVRLVYGQHPMSPSGFAGTPAEGLVGGEDRMGWLAEDWCGNVVGDAEAHTLRCPYGVPGDRLYVREAWRVPKSLDALSGAAIAAKALDAGYRKPWCPVQYEADGARREWDRSEAIWPQQAGRYRHARFMPRWASRITLEVTGVRVERLQSITEADARAEGMPHSDGVPGAFGPTQLVVEARKEFRHLWDEINGAESWESDPWVWVVSFRRVEG